MHNLEEHRAVAKGGAGLRALRAAYALVLDDAVFKIGILDKGALDRGRGAELVLSGGVELLHSLDVVAAAQVAVAAERITVDTLHSRGLDHAEIRTFTAMDALAGVDLPNGLFLLVARKECTSCDSQTTCKSGAQEVASFIILVHLVSF